MKPAPFPDRCVPFLRVAPLFALLIAIHLALLAVSHATPLSTCLRGLALATEGLLASVTLFYGAHRSAEGQSGLGSAWGLLALAQAFCGLSDAMRLVALITAQAEPAATAAPIFGAAYYPVFLAGIVTFVFGRPQSSPVWSRNLLDLGILLLGVILLASAFLLGPLLDARMPLPASLRALAPAAGNLVLLAALLAILQWHTSQQRQTPLALIAAGIAIQLVAQTVAVRGQVLTGQESWQFIEAARVGNSALAALAGAFLAAGESASSDAQDARRSTTVWQLLVPCSFLIAAYALLIWRHQHASALGFEALAAGVGLMMFLVLIRLMDALVENNHFHNQLLEVNADLERRVEERMGDLSRINERLESEVRTSGVLYGSLRVANNQLRAALQGRDEMVQNVSHELRTPVSLILSYVDLLADQQLGQLEDDQIDALETIQRQGQRLLSMVSRLLTLQTFEPGKLVLLPLGLSGWMRDLADAWQVRAYKAGIVLEADIAEGLPAVLVDCDYLGQVFENLLDNAMKFTPRQGHVLVRARATPEGLALAVCDSGVGIPRDKLTRIFERFYQVDSAKDRSMGGLGIGLALCKTIVEAHRGRIWVESDGENRGSRFYITLPACRDV